MCLVQYQVRKLQKVESKTLLLEFSFFFSDWHNSYGFWKDQKNQAKRNRLEDIFFGSPDLIVIKSLIHTPTISLFIYIYQLIL